MTDTKSNALFKRAEKVIPGGVNSPVRSCKHVGTTPIYFEKGEGPYLYSVDGKRYTDFCLSFGPHLLGHSHPAVVSAITEQVKLATSFGACHPKEVDFAEAIIKAYPFLGKVRLVNSGTEAVMTAVRIARGFTGRSRIIVFDGCYHGHSDGLLAKAGSGVAELSEATSKGIPNSIVKDTLVASWNDLKTVEKYFEEYPGEIAAIVLEPIPANYGLRLTAKSELQSLMTLAKKEGALVVFDEVINGFRLGQSGACGYFDLRPDLVTLGKIIGGGLPLAAVAGRTEVMDKLAPVGDVYQAGTLSGNPLAVAAGLAVLKEIETNPPYAQLEKRTSDFVTSLEKMVSKWKPVKIHTIASLFWLEFGNPSKNFPPEISTQSKQTYSEFFKRALKGGAYFAPSPYEVAFLSTAHTESVLENVLESLEECLTAP